MQYTGTVKFIGPKENVGTNGIEKQTIVLEEETDKEFKGGLAIDFFKEKIELLNNIKVGDRITVYLNTRANESKIQPGKWFNSITGWRIEKNTENIQSKKEEEQDDLPF